MALRAKHPEQRAQRIVLASIGVAVVAISVDLLGATPFESGLVATCASVGLRLGASALSLFGLWRFRDVRFAVFAVLAALMAMPQLLSLAQHAGWELLVPSVLLTEIPGYVVSVLALLVLLTFLRAVPEARLRQEFQRKLHEEIERYRGLFEENVAVKLLIDPSDGSIVEANGAAAEFYGWSRAELTTMKISQINCLPPEEVRAEMQRAHAEGKRAFHFRHRRRDGSIRDVHVYSGPVESGGRTLLFSIVFDVTAQLEAEAASTRLVRALDDQTRMLAEARRESDEASRNKSAFLANMSHEIRTPMTAVLGFAEALREGGLSDEEEREAIETIYDSGEYLLQLINQILDLARVEAGKMEVDEADVDVPHLVDRVHGLLAQRAEDAGLEFVTRIEGAVPRSVRTDELKVRQILVNLTGNAIKYTDTGRVELSVAHDALEDELLFAVSDTGAGLDEDGLRRAFEPFDQPGKGDNHTGSGLGLPIARQFARLLGGSLTATSTPGVGSTFRLRLPARRTAGTPWVDQATATRATQHTGPARHPEPRHVQRPAHVLVAEDVAANQTLVRRILERAGVDVDVVGDGLQAVEAVRDAAVAGSPYSLVLMDVQMPVMGGIEATRTLNDEFPSLPVLALTAGVTTDELDALRKAGMRETVAKPFDRDELLAAIERWSVAPSDPAPTV